MVGGDGGKTQDYLLRAAASLREAVINFQRHLIDKG